MYDDDEYGDENPLKQVLNKFAQKVLKKTARNSSETLQISGCSNKKKNYINHLNNLTINSLIR